MFIGAYVGARPLGRPLPPLADAPTHPAVPLHLLYAFARDPAHDGMFQFYGKNQSKLLAGLRCRAAAAAHAPGAVRPQLRFCLPPAFM